MNWINNYQLFLFDFDGILVNTEELHQEAYVQMCKGRGEQLTWDFPRYCMAAHFESTGLRDQIYAEFPPLFNKEPDWAVLYKEKKDAYKNLLKSGAVQLMPGVEKLLLALQAANIKRCVVTHSPEEHVNLIREQNPLLNSIPKWFTREDYSHAKPHPECYLKAISELGEQGDHIIGFEDTPRGLKALQATKAQAVFVSTVPYPNMQEIVTEKTIHISQLADFSTQQSTS